MRQVALAAIRQREAINFGFKVSFIEETDLRVKDVPFPRSELRVLMAQSEVTAVVPFKITETITILADEEKQTPLPLIVDRLIANVPRSFFGYDATIHRQIFVGAEFSAAVGNERKARVTWIGEASWGGGR